MVSGVCCSMSFVLTAMGILVSVSKIHDLPYGMYLIIHPFAFVLDKYIHLWKYDLQLSGHEIPIAIAGEKLYGSGGPHS